MDDTQTNDDRYIGSNQYFQDALNWYCGRYLLCITERAWLFVISLFLSSILLILILDIFSYFPLKTNFSFTKYTDHYTDEFSVIKKLSTNNEDSEETLLSQYLVAQYVKKYESYLYNDLDSQFNFIKNNSSRKIYLAFKEMIASHHYIDNSKYNAISIETTIHNVKLLSKDFTSSNNAIVTFKKQIAINGVISHVQSYKVLVTFSLSSIKMAISGIMPLEFLVHDYKKLD
ncbi:virB8 family protein [Ehrlichia chaffeensis str. Heartland]|uniref:Type IV secretion system protein VirB8 n=1 Tax=Ehrlichia chaffeensis (strain ATCC CRL-10679 / Arkansas) TaxID=205920 RepID=Q2GGP3_EHRCR|nr:type IV secretion system protein [Ehrlichia chaffeensis]ABD44776.1 type IV secretion system protein VirB8 [Ehrlichia chaffeensis str. Arkansas]AHX03668.1 virB8 family protein [Ehrlichia chaffeensis str. Heartland]AHX05611.1 virB8 family protein [Ehrlichia chaffeensis str. Jax]AHX06602.1 virB8 family protein [Ehrlichia chaffeensis str. Liberty]AHX07671.1 virB8 family protein [Ehrlichia chaffeensis str. Osceola]